MWKFIGMPLSVPISSVTPASRSCLNLRASVGRRAGRELKVGQPIRMLERLPDVGDDRVRQTLVPRRIVERFRVVAQVLVVEQPFDRRRPVERTERHLRGALADRGDDVVGIRRRGRQPGVLEAVDADRKPAADLLGTMRVRDDRLAALVRFVHDRAHLVDRHLILIDQLDDVDAGVGDLPHLRARRRRVR